MKDGGGDEGWPRVIGWVPVLTELDFEGQVPAEVETLTGKKPCHRRLVRPHVIGD